MMYLLADGLSMYRICFAAVGSVVPWYRHQMMFVPSLVLSRYYWIILGARVGGS